MRISRSRSTSRPSARSSAMAAAIASALACAGPGPAGAEQVIAQLAAASARQIAVLDSVVNGQPQGPVFAIVERGETQAIEVAALRRWRIKVPGDLAFEFEDRLYVAVADLGGVRTNIEQRTQRLLVNVSPSLLEHADIQFPAAVIDTKLSTDTACRISELHLVRLHIVGHELCIRIF